METKVNGSYMERIMRRCGFVSGINVSSSGRSGGLCLWWRELEIEVISYSNHHIAANICDTEGVPCCSAVGVYGWSEVSNRYRTWELMQAMLKQWARITFGDIKKKIKTAEGELHTAQAAPIDANMLETCKNLSEEIDELRRMEESYWYARARSNELRDGDKNTAYFHRKASNRRSRNRINGLYDKNGDWQMGSQQIQNIAIEYFEALFASGYPTDFDSVVSGLEQRITGAMNAINIDSLTHKVMKSHYFKSSDVIRANRGHDPSFVWRSIWNAKGVFPDGMVWKVGDGRDIKVWEDNWLVKEEGPIILHQCPNSNANMKVAELLDEESGEWNANMVRTMLGAENVARVLAVPLSANPTKDTIYWRLTNNGEFIVRSCYWLARLGNENSAPSVSSGKCWRSIWRLQGPPKLRFFIWSVVRGNIAVKERLCQRHITTNTTCQVCHHPNETVLHSLFYCSYARRIWECSDFIEELDAAPTHSFEERWLWPCSHLSVDRIRTLAALMWASWRCRNVHIFENQQPDAVKMASGFCKMVSDYMQYT
uniref:Reverse transcriptase zinc-binding domain-containing protein n=1 Tax=Chenopodium quinoa TaxID=63459 RepID=A0A803LSC1_CHEQI